MTLVRSDRARSVLRGALRTGFSWPDHVSVIDAEEWSDVRSALEARPVAVVVFELGHPSLAPLTTVAATVRRFSQTEFVVYAGGLKSERLQDVVEMVRAGVRYTVTAGVDDEPERIRELLERSFASGAEEAVLRPARTRLTPDQMDLLRMVVRHAPEATRVQRLARVLNMSRRTLERRADDAGLPSPSWLLSWIHLYHVSRRLLFAGVPVERAITGSGLSSGSAFRRALRRVLGLTTTELRELGRGRLASAFVDVLASNAERPDVERPSPLVRSPLPWRLRKRYPPLGPRGPESERWRDASPA